MIIILRHIKMSKKQLTRDRRNICFKWSSKLKQTLNVYINTYKSLNKSIITIGIELFFLPNNRNWTYNHTYEIFLSTVTKCIDL